MIRQHTKEFLFSTKGRGFVNITPEIVGWVRENYIESGLLTIFIRHTSASLLVQENADSDVLRDMEQFFLELVKDGDPKYLHVSEGKDDMSAHIRCALTQTHLSIPVVLGKPTLGMWQAIYIYEHRLFSHQRSVLTHLIGE
jgi:secondary thiamine-phosphate synthase enzyme